MKTGIELIAQERAEQIEKHGRTVEYDAENNQHGQILNAVVELILNEEKMSSGDVFYFMPPGWDGRIFMHMLSKPIVDRLVIAGALIAAEIDRIQFDNNKSNGE